MVLGNDRPAVPALHGVGHLAGLGAVELQGHVGQVGEVLHRQIALPDLPVLHKVDGDRVLAAVGDGGLGHQLLQSALSLGGADELIVHIQGVAVLHHAGPELVAEGGLQLLLLHHRAAEGQVGGVGDLAGLHGVVAADGVRDGALHRQEGGLGLLLAGHGGQLLPFEGHGGGGGVEHPEHGKHRDGQPRGQKDRRMDQPAAAGRAPLGPGGQGQQGRVGLMEPGAELAADQGHTAGQQQAQLAVGIVGLGKALAVSVAG